ncbi:esterase family protein [Kitasatospora sp. GAS204B]|uniref:alpha/beta hydrolase n=1 Tax=unclassified Kitasatospora TaxID=2633591 RepID=UPI00247604A7|nr:alpha/beta hydrolase-fold protein [Kitasatospora sp. GAS204B]MDH6116299.1 enterochelin esterase-like enzyme [Kitasatospora sp. GAS204B]
MALTGTPFFILTIVLFVGSIALAMAQFRARGKGSAVRGSSRRRRAGGGSAGGGPLQAVGYLTTILFCQVTAVAMVFVVVNNENQLYDNWADLLGTSSHVQAVPVPPKDNGLAGDRAAGSAAPRQKQVLTFKPASSDAVPKDVKQADLKGQLSGVEGEVLVWTPPQYDDPAYQNKTFPVVELLAGYPGSSSTWFGDMAVTNQLSALMKSGQVTPFILVSPRVQLLNNADTGCADVPGKVNADTWLSRDVPQMVIDNFRADDTAAGWALAGFSAGAHCANRLAIGHPDRYRAAIAMSGYNDPIGEKASLTYQDPKLRVIDNPLYMLTHAQTPPNIGLWETGKKGDGLEDAVALQQAAKSPTAVTTFETTGAHLISTWKPLVAPSFEWLSKLIPAP